jgi:ElaA protein
MQTTGVKLTWHCKHFDALTAAELYNILRLRTEVFILEQNCLYQDVDGKDVKCFHLFAANENNEVLAYARILPQGISYNEVSIGRVVTSPKVRGTGTGKVMMEKVMDFIKKEFGNTAVRISAQSYLIKFYSDFGFAPVGEDYLEDDIPHRQMLFRS